MTDCRYLVRSAESDPKNSDAWIMWATARICGRPKVRGVRHVQTYIRVSFVTWRGRAGTACKCANANDCLDREMLIQKLETRYNESLNGAGLQGPKSILEIWSSEDSGSFTIWSPSQMEKAASLLPV